MLVKSPHFDIGIILCYLCHAVGETWRFFVAFINVNSSCNLFNRNTFFKLRSNLKIVDDDDDADDDALH